MPNSMAKFTFSFLSVRKYPFWANLVTKIKIVCLKRRLAPRLINTSMQNLIQFSCYDRKYPLWANWSGKLNLLVCAEIWYLDQFDYAECKDGVNLFCFRLFLDKFGSKNQNCLFKLKLGTI